MKINRRLGTVAGVCAGLLAAPAIAQVPAYDNFGPGNTWSTSGYLIRGPQHASTAPDWTNGHQFLAEASGGIVELTVSALHQAGTNHFRYEIYSDDNGLPGSSLGQFDNLFFPAPRDLLTIPGDGSIQLLAGELYWLIAFGVGDAGGNWSQNPIADSGPRVWSRDQGLTWSHSASANKGVFRIMVSGEPECYANCDGSTTEPVLTVNDFTCFINEFASAQTLPPAQQIEHYANCDGSSTEPILTVNDFTCFINEFAQGCP